MFIANIVSITLISDLAICGKILQWYVFLADMGGHTRFKYYTWILDISHLLIIFLCFCIIAGNPVSPFNEVLTFLGIHLHVTCNEHRTEQHLQPWNIHAICCHENILNASTSINGYSCLLTWSFTVLGETVLVLFLMPSTSQLVDFLTTVVTVSIVFVSLYATIAMSIAISLRLVVGALELTTPRFSTVV